MVTNLLLEGDDLEALLIKAHSEGGPSARIVRADKYRHGGVWGFFARERFEVAVEIPEPGGRAQPTHQAQPAHQGQSALPRPRTQQAPRAEGPREQARHLPAHPPVRRTLEREPELGALAAESLLGLADRVSAAERAAARAADAALHARPAAMAGREPVASIDLHEADLVGTHVEGPTAPAAPHGTAAPAAPHGTAAPAAPHGTALRSGWPADLPSGSTVSPTVTMNGTVTSSMTSRHVNPTADPTGDRHDFDPSWADLREPNDPLTGVGEPSLESVELYEADRSPVHPSTTRPEFTALLDQLRSGTRSARRSSGPPARPPAAAATAATSTAAAAYLGADLPSGSDEPAEQACAQVTPLRWVPAQARSAAAESADAPPSDEPSTEDVAERAPRAGETRAGDARAAADRKVLRQLGVPSAWTRRLRPGDRFAEVLRMLERMPDPDIDPEAAVIAVVGPADRVTLEAYRTAVDLATEAGPRAVVVIPRAEGAERTAAINRAPRSGPVVLAVEADGVEAAGVLEALNAAAATAVIAIVDATVPLEDTQRWLDALGQVDALTLEGAGVVPAPATVLQLGLPVVRLDGIPVDRVTWTALLCAQLTSLAAAQ